MSKRAEPLPAGIPNVQRRPSFLAGRWAIMLAGVVLVLAALGAYHNSFSVPFLFDDADAITDNPTIRHLWPVWPVLSPPAGGLTVSGRPLVNLSLAVNHALGGTDVWGYHALNLAIHVLASLTLMGIVRRTLLLKPALPEHFGAAALPLALVVALLWALHPLQTESVTYVVQRAESLMGLFYLLTLYTFIRGTQSGAAGWYVLALGACLLGMATKEVMVSAPLIVWLYDRTFVAGTFAGALRQRWRVYAGLGTGWLLLAYLVAKAGEFGSERAGFHTAVTWWSYALTQFWAMAHYLWLSVWPHPLVFDYGTMLVTRPAEVVPPAILVAVLAAGTLVAVRRWPALGFLGVWFFAILAPTSSVMPLAGQTVAEHRMYLPLAAVVTVAVLGVYAWVGRRSMRMFLACAAVSGLLTLGRNEDYRSGVAIWNDTMTKRPNNARAHNNLGSALFRLGRGPEALGPFEEALRLDPDYAEAHYNLGNALIQLGITAEAVSQFKQALRVNPDYTKAHSNLGMALFQQGRVPEAIWHLEAALRVEPDLADLHNNLGVVLMHQGKVTEALGQYEQALRLKPDLAEAHNALGNILLQQGKVSEAIGRYEQAVRLKPEYADAHYNLGSARLRRGNVPEAIAHFEQAVRLKPRDVEPRKQLAWLLATCGEALVRNGARALELAEKANQLAGGKDAGTLDILAAAYAEARRFDEAVRTAQAALELANGTGQAEAARPIQERLELYQAGRPYREESEPAP